ncbi:TELO2-interacting protein 2 [Cephus cinctus]|uniref:TELO2-interacting protein 2 n=1 Tax=Cephus cinctus TaxID=211228 RepID=A0AAJ7CDN2_CEPCN|nr:TELO2-interacting protein 2 [Cephus cinctus]
MGDTTKEDCRINENFWKNCVELIEKTLVPEKSIGASRPCEQKDFREYRQTVDEKLNVLKCTLQSMCYNNNNDSINLLIETPIEKLFTVHLLLLIGEHCEQNVWNTAHSVHLSKELESILCDICHCTNVYQIMIKNDIISSMLLILRPKLFKNTWKAYPAAVTSYKWLLQQVQKPRLLNYMTDILPTALIILDDYVPNNKIIALECLRIIMEHGFMARELVEHGYADVIFDALEHLTHHREAQYIIPLYSCISLVLRTLEIDNNDENLLEWSKRDDVLLTLLNNMECEQNLELRETYMLSLLPLLTKIGSAKWCKRLTRIIVEYCQHYTHIKTIRATLRTARGLLQLFHPRMAAHCVVLYTAFLKLWMDLAEAAVFDNETIHILKECIFLLQKLTPVVGRVIYDDRVRLIINNCSQFAT